MASLRWIVEHADCVFFTETGEPLTKTVIQRRLPLIGVCRGDSELLPLTGVMLPEFPA